MTRSDSTILVTQIWLDSTKSWLDSDSNRQNFRWLWLDYDSKGSWLWLDKNDSGTSLAVSKLAHTRVYFASFLIFVAYIALEFKRKDQVMQKQAIFLFAHFSFDCFSSFYTFHNAWAHTASMSIIPTDACLLKPVGIANKQQLLTQKICFIFTHIFTILKWAFFKYYIVTSHASYKRRMQCVGIS